jgi:hypothetical protein
MEDEIIVFLSYGFGVCNDCEMGLYRFGEKGDGIGRKSLTVSEIWD